MKTERDTMKTEEFLIEPTNGRPDVRFTGQLLASVSSARHNSTQWTDINAYKTTGGKWVIETLGQVSEDAPAHMECRVNVLVFDNTEDMTRKVGFGRLAEQLYKKLGINEVTID